MTSALLALTACGGGDPSGTSSSATTNSSTEPAGDPLADVQTFEGLASGHKTFADLPLTYAQIPPVGGDHLAQWQNCGYYANPVRDEAAVHSVEHGAVWITYQPDLPADQVATLASKVDGHPYVLVSPRDDLPAPVVASAWGKQLAMQSADDPGVDVFIAAFENGPQNPEPGAPCSGGLDITADEPPPPG